MTLAIQLIIDIGLQFPISSLSPSLKMGVTLAIFRQLGKYPCEKQLLINFGRIFAIEIAPNLKSFGNFVIGFAA